MKSLSQVEEDLRRRALEALQIVDHNEINNWLKHPCTQYILRTLEADYMSHHISWEECSLTAESAEGTSQLNAKALGAINALTLIAEAIDDLSEIKAELTQEEEEEEHV